MLQKATKHDYSGRRWNSVGSRPLHRFVDGGNGCRTLVRPGKEAPVGATRVKADLLNELRNSELGWSSLRLRLVYDDGGEPLTAVPRVIAAMKWHPAQTFSLAHQRDVARAFEVALTGVLHGRIVSIVDDAPTIFHEMANIAGSSIEPSAEPLTNPSIGRMDGSRSRSLGFRPTFATVYQAAHKGIL